MYAEALHQLGARVEVDLDSCAGCHAQPAVGGSSPSINPQIAVATKAGATNSAPFFITANGPVREVRFKFRDDGTRDGGVHNLYTIAGRSDAPGCALTQPDFKREAARNNIIFRIPVPVFGAGLIEEIPDAAILANQQAAAPSRAAMGVGGKPNRQRLADDIIQGLAGPDEFRTAPLWGLGQRIFFLHDGRTTDLIEAIEAHESKGKKQYPPSEANAVIARFRALESDKKQDLLNFLRSL